MKSDALIKSGLLALLNPNIPEERKKTSKDEEKNSYKCNRNKFQFMKRKKRKLQRMFRRRNR